MITDFEFYHGAVFAKLLHASKAPLTIRTFESASNASYVVNEECGIFIKHSAKRMTPWRFTFNPTHQQEIDELKNKLGAVVLILVCADDGLACLAYDELKVLLDDQHGAAEWISVTRFKRQMYAVKGSDGNLEFKVGRSDFLRKIGPLSGLHLQAPEGD